MLLTFQQLVTRVTTAWKGGIKLRLMASPPLGKINPLLDLRLSIIQQSLKVLYYLECRRYRTR